MLRQIREGVELIINGYNTYISVLTSVVTDIRKYVEGLINRYTAELSVLEQIMPKCSVTSIGSTNNGWRPQSDYKRIMAIYGYGQVSRQVLGYGLDSVNDFIRDLVARHAAIFNSPVQQWQDIDMDSFDGYRGQTGLGSIFIACGSMNQNNANPKCARDVAAASVSHIRDLCQCPFLDQSK
jgi:hypothetical protein